MHQNKFNPAVALKRAVEENSLENHISNCEVEMVQIARIFTMMAGMVHSLWMSNINQQAIHPLMLCSGYVVLCAQW